MVDLNKIFNADFNKILDYMQEFLDEARMIRDSLYSDIYELLLIQDEIRKVLRIEDKIMFLWHLRSLILNMETDKDKFEVQKLLNLEFESFLMNLDELIKSVRTTKFDDYRCIDWGKRLVGLLVATKQYLC